MLTCTNLIVACMKINFEKYRAPWRRSINLPTRGNRYEFLIVSLFKHMQLIHNSYGGRLIGATPGKKSI